jgi:hypothetical protein
MAIAGESSRRVELRAKLTTTFMNNPQRQGQRSPEPATAEELLLDIRKRLGRIERHLIAVLQGEPQRPQRGGSEQRF